MYIVWCIQFHSDENTDWVFHGRRVESDRLDADSVIK